MFEIETIGFEENSIKPIEITDTIPLLVLRNTLLMPGITIPINVARSKSIQLIEEVSKSNNKILAVATQQDPEIDEPEPEDILPRGVVAIIQRIIKMPDGSITVILKAYQKVEILEFVKVEPFFVIKAVNAKEPIYPASDITKALLVSLKNEAIKVIELIPNLPKDALIPLHNINDLDILCNFILTNLNLPISDKFAVFDEIHIEEKVNYVLQLLKKEQKVLEISEEIQNKIKIDLDKQQREFFLRHQLKTIQEELNDTEFDDEINRLKEKAAKKKWSKEAQEVFNREVNKLYRTNPNAPEYSVIMNYLEWLLELPWGEYTKDQIDLAKAQEILDKEHYGLEKVKKRIIEYLAVIKLKKDLKSPILCLYGPPGVGKTSLGKSIAKALKRKFARISLGGVRDEAEIRGHRRTYIGAMPGKIIQTLRKVKKGNPVIVLDEVDKIGQDWKGDPSSALLEVLDPEQNFSFNDHFLEVDYDLSSVMFIATANTLDTLHPALRDRLEIIEVNGYSFEEKLEIAKRHLIPNQIKEHGLSKKMIAFEEEAIKYLINHYTRESGVRKLTQVIAAVCRGAAKEIVEGNTKKININQQKIREYLGIEKYDHEELDTHEFSGVATGLAWTSVGGETLTIETAMFEGTGKISLSGQLGDVMKESANLAYTYIKANKQKWNISSSCFKDFDTHLHIPAGAIPKDGPSAGVTMLTAMVSLYTQNPVKSHLAMSGEISLRGQVLPVGGIKEKVLAAARAGVDTIILPYSNKKEVSEIPEYQIKNLKFHFVKNIDEVIKIALPNLS
jgi:ATP-dependent Lon protease